MGDRDTIRGTMTSAQVNKTGSKRRGKVMDITVWVMLILAGALVVIAYMRDPHLPLQGLRAGGKLFWDILPSLFLAFIAAGMISMVLPRELMTRWLGEESGLRGLVIATLAGSVTPGGPFVQFPIVAALLKSGAGIAPLMAYLTAWSLLGLNRILVYEIPMLGWKLALSRIAASLIFPIIIGLITRFLWLKF
jgi:uncharacterized membrane protein YraQ (UPF0718 family)